MDETTSVARAVEACGKIADEFVIVARANIKAQHRVAYYAAYGAAAAQISKCIRLLPPPMTSQERDISESIVDECITVLEDYSDQLCEGWCEGAPEWANFEDCGGCRAFRLMQKAKEAGLGKR